MSILPVQPNFDDGFTPENDIFGRKKLYEQIKNIALMQSDESIVLGLDDDWGNGKTSFVKMVVGEINKFESDNFNIIYFDAFKSDYQSDPLLAMLASIYSMIDIKTNDASLKEDFLKVSKAVALSMLKHTPKAVIGLLSAKLVSNEMCDVIKDSVTDAISDPLEKFIEEKIEGASKEITEIENFKNMLEKIYTVTNRKTLFIIDELDRAKPDFSLGILEKIKHLFDVKGFCFLLVMNKPQFEETIKLTYGNINTSIYLNKFVHLWLKLPILKKVNVSGKNMDLHSKYSFDILSKYIGIYINNENIKRCLSYFLVKNNLSLREADRCITLFNLCYSNEIENNYEIFECYAISLLIFMRVKNVDLMVGFLHKEKSKDDVRKELHIGGATDAICSNAHALIDYHYCDDDTLNTLFYGKKNPLATNTLNSMDSALKQFANNPDYNKEYVIGVCKVNVFEKIAEKIEYIEIP